MILRRHLIRIMFILKGEVGVTEVGPSFRASRGRTATVLTKPIDRGAGVAHGGGVAVPRGGGGRRGRAWAVLCAHQLPDVGLRERRAVDVRRPSEEEFGPAGAAVAPRGAAGGGGGGGGDGGGVGERGLEGQWGALPWAQVGVSQGGVQREQVGWRRQDLGPLGVRESGRVRLIWREKSSDTGDTTNNP